MPLIVNVDDNEPARYARSRLLKLAGFEVRDAGTGADALKVIREGKPDMVLLDVHLPDVSGIDVCRAIKTDPQSASIIVLQISASAISAPQATAALDAGADSYLIEPVDSEVLIATIRALLRLRHAERELAETNAALVDANHRLNATNQALQRSNDDLEHFAYIASHDLQEPLRTISTHLQLLSRTAESRLGPSDLELFGFVVEAAGRMRDVIDGVLAFSRIGRDTPHVDTTALDDSLDWAIKNLGESVTAAGAQITRSELPVVLGDAVQLGQLFQNLISNAIKYRSEKESPKIDVTGEREADGQVIVHVRDNGVGIEAEHHDRVFRPFKRLHGREIPGTGIGLALCRRIVEAHGGTIWVDSEPGKGSTFSFTIRSVAASVITA